MTPEQLDTLAALVAKGEAVRCTTLQDKRALYEAEVALMNAAPELLRLARIGLEVEAEVGHTYCVTCGSTLHQAKDCELTVAAVPAVASQSYSRIFNDGGPHD